MRICIDLDGTICDIRRPEQSYADVAIKPGAKEVISNLRKAGHTVIIHTARNMQTQGHNVGAAVANVGLTTLLWLKDNGVEYDEIFFGKPNADVTIDDRVIRFSSWNSEDIVRLCKE